MYGLLLVTYIYVKERVPMGATAAVDESRKELDVLLDDLTGSHDGLKELARRRCSEGSGPEQKLIRTVLEQGADTDTLVRAIRSAGVLRLRDCVPLLGDLLSHGVPEVGEEAAKSLGAIGDPTALDYLLARSEQLDKELQTLDRGQLAATGRALQDAPAGEVEFYAPADEVEFYAPAEKVEMYAPAGEVKMSMESAPLARILPALAAENYRILDSRTPYKLAELDESGLVDVLLEVAADTTALTSHRYYAIRNLAYFRRIGLVKELADFLGDVLPAIRFAAADTIGQLGGANAATALLNALKDANPYVRSAAAAGLATLGDDRGLVPLMELRTSPDEVVRFTAERALQSLRTRKDIGSLLTRPRQPATAAKPRGSE